MLVRSSKSIDFKKKVYLSFFLIMNFAKNLAILKDD
jgi:hypothetical protein